MNIKKLVNLIFEWQHLKRIKHEGWRLAGVSNPDSVAEHSLVAAQIGYILAKMEWADVGKVVSMLIWHDIHEARIQDVHKLSLRYLWKKKLLEMEDKALQEQFEGLEFEKEIRQFNDEMNGRITLEWKIAKDADYLEQAFYAKYYVEIWYEAAQDWINNVWKTLQTDSAKKLFNEMLNTSFSQWWEGLKQV